MNRRRYAHTRTGTVRHLVTNVSEWYSGMTGTAECGTRVQVEEEQPPTGHGVVFPVGTCQRCARNLNGTVRQPEARPGMSPRLEARVNAQLAPDRSDIIGFRDGSPIRGHPDSTPAPKTLALTIVLDAAQFEEEGAVEHFHRELIGQLAHVDVGPYRLDGAIEGTETR